MAESTTSALPTASDTKSHRPTKKRALSPTSQHQASLEALFAHPDREITIPSSTLQTRTAASAPPEIVANVQGSSAGAGSGEFHVYKASRRREYERLRIMDEEVAKEKADEEFEKRQAEMRRRDQERLEKNRAKRDKAKARRGKGKGGNEGKEGGQEGEGGRKRLGAAKVGAVGNGNGNGDGGERVGGGESAGGGEEEVGIVIHDDD